MSSSLKVGLVCIVSEKAKHALLTWNADNWGGLWRVQAVEHTIRVDARRVYQTRERFFEVLDAVGRVSLAEV